MDLPAASSFQIKPELASIIQTEAVKKICQRVLTDTLLEKTYSTENAKKWSKSIADEINRNLKERDESRYRHVVQVVILQKFGQGFKFCGRCRWDCECDRQITDSFTNDTLICIVSVFGVYSY